jgi:hypothetical protein
MNTDYHNDHQDTLPLTQRLSATPSVQQNQLAATSSQLIQQVQQSTDLLSLFCTKAEKERRRNVKIGLLNESDRVAQAHVAKAAELLRLGTAIAQQAYIDQLRVEYRDTVGVMAQQAENDLREGVINLYSAKVDQLESLQRLEIDPELKQIASQVVCRLTEASTAQLLRHNTKPS